MQPLFLTSSVNGVANHIGKKLKAEQLHQSLLFIDTAAEVEEGDKSWLEADRQSLIDAGFKVSDYTITGKSAGQVRESLANIDIIYVSGGNTFYLLDQMHKSGFFEVIHEFVPSSKIYISTSAGSIVAGPDIEIFALGDSPDDAPDLTNYTGLNLTNISTLPHWGSPDFVRDFEKVIKIMYQPENKFILLNDYQYIEIQSDKFQFIDVRQD